MVLGGQLTQDEYVQKKFVIINDKKVIPYIPLIEYTLFLNLFYAVSWPRGLAV